MIFSLFFREILQQNHERPDHHQLNLGKFLQTILVSVKLPPIPITEGLISTGAVTSTPRILIVYSASPVYEPNARLTLKRPKPPRSNW